MKKLLWWIAVSLLVFLPACGAPATPAPASPGESGEPSNLLVAVQGDVLLKREGWSEYARAVFGSPVRNGDLFKLDDGSQAKVACSDLTLVSMTPGVSGAPCKVERPVLMYKGSQVSATRAVPSSDYPTTVTPRKTKLLNSRPVLRWTEVPGTAAYKVAVRGPNLEWTAETPKTELVYPDDAPALSPGVTYKLSVDAGDRNSDQEGTPGLGFMVLGADEAQGVRDAESRIRALGLEDAPTRLLIASLYANQDLAAEAVQQLEELPEGEKGPAVQRLLGDLYLKTGLNFLAEEHYLKALEASKQADDLEGQAASHWVLGQLYELTGSSVDAVKHMQEAVVIYEKLGDSATVKQIKERLAQLQQS